MLLTFQDICAARFTEHGFYGLLHEALHTVLDLIREIPLAYLWLAIDLGNRKLLSFAGSALAFTGLAYISPICPTRAEGEEYASH